MRWSVPTPDAAWQPHFIIDPPPCFTVGMVFLVDWLLYFSSNRTGAKRTGHHCGQTIRFLFHQTIIQISIILYFYQQDLVALVDVSCWVEGSSSAVVRATSLHARYWTLYSSKHPRLCLTAAFADPSLLLESYSHRCYNHPWHSVAYFTRATSSWHICRWSKFFMFLNYWLNCWLWHMQLLRYLIVTISGLVLVYYASLAVRRQLLPFRHGIRWCTDKIFRCYPNTTFLSAFQNILV